MKLTILERPTSLTEKDFQARLGKELELLKGELNASITMDGFSNSGWTQLHVTGEDSEITAELISKKFSLAHTTPHEIELPGNYPAQIVGSNERGLKLDLGFGTKSSECLIPTSNLNTQLADGKNLPLRQLVECYCLYPGVRVAIRVDRKTGYAVQGWLSDDFLDTLADWVTTGLDRILVFECFKREAESAALKAHLSRDVIAIDSVTLTIQSIVCKLGTDAVGLIPQLGRILRKQPLKPFQPNKITSRCRPW